MIEVKNLTKVYGEKKVIEDVSFKIEEGKMISLIGPNGAGKSTVLSMMSRLTSIDSGEVIIDGKKLSEWRNDDLSKVISVLKQSNNINLRLTVKELVEFGRFPYSKGRINKEDLKYIDKAIDYMNLTDIQDKYLDELSGGQKQRAYIAMIIAQDTKYIFLDEPLNNLDIKYCVQMMKVIRSLVDDLNKTVITVLHDINFTSAYSDTIISMKNGQIFEQGNAEDVINKHKLENLYDTQFKICDIHDKKVCVYF